jgi:hypothetical protein
MSLRGGLSRRSNLLARKSEDCFAALAMTPLGSEPRRPLTNRPDNDLPMSLRGGLSRRSNLLARKSEDCFAALAMTPLGSEPRRPLTNRPDNDLPMSLRGGLSRRSNLLARKSEDCFAALAMTPLGEGFILTFDDVGSYPTWTRVRGFWPRPPGRCPGSGPPITCRAAGRMCTSSLWALR